MGLLDEWSRRAQEHRDERVAFLGEQAGSVEETLKRDLILEFATRPDIRRAYLARVTFQSDSTPSVAVCIVSKRPEDKSLLVRVGEIMRRRFARDAAMDVIFLTPVQEADITAVCRPFYGSVT